jgi:hypothetical protein
MSEQQPVEQQYDLDGNSLSEVDQAMEEVANASDNELNSSPSIKVLYLKEYRTLRQHASTSSQHSEFSNVSLEEKVSARDELDALLAASEEEMISNAVRVTL